jgi:membrane protein required for beta-lactamase induction
MDFDLETLTKILQASISPVAMISGVGLLILSLTNRFSRVADRLRELARNEAAEPALKHAQEQIRIFVARAALLRSSIACAVGSALVTSVLVLVLFAIAVLHVPLHLLVFGLFGLSLVLLIASLTIFLRDMQLSLHALNEQLRP